MGLYSVHFWLIRKFASTPFQQLHFNIGNKNNGLKQPPFLYLELIVKGNVSIGVIGNWVERSRKGKGFVHNSVQFIDIKKEILLNEIR